MRQAMPAAASTSVPTISNGISTALATQDPPSAWNPGAHSPQSSAERADPAPAVDRPGVSFKPLIEACGETENLVTLEADVTDEAQVAEYVALARQASRFPPPPPRMHSMTIGLPTVMRHCSSAASLVKAKADELVAINAQTVDEASEDRGRAIKRAKSAAIPDIGRPQIDFGAI